MEKFSEQLFCRMHLIGCFYTKFDFSLCQSSILRSSFKYFYFWLCDQNFLLFWRVCEKNNYHFFLTFKSWNLYWAHPWLMNLVHTVLLKEFDRYVTTVSIQLWEVFRPNGRYSVVFLYSKGFHNVIMTIHEI